MLTILKKNDTHDSIEYQITNDDGSVVNLTGATVNFVMGKKNKLITNAPAVITAANDGIVEYQLTSTDTLVSGTFLAEFVVTFSNGTQKTFPSNGYITVTVEQNLDTNQANVVLDMIAEKQGDFTSKLNSILLQAGNINMSAMNEYTWTATEGQLIYTFPPGSNYSNSTKWFQVSVGNVPVANSLVNRSYANQFALIIDPTYIQAGMEVRAMWVEPIVPITTGHHATHEINGQDEIDITKLRNYQELIATPLVNVSYNPKSFGCKLDGVTDDTDNLQSFFDNSIVQGKVRFPSGSKLLVTRPIYINKDNLEIDFNGCEIYWNNSVNLGVDAQNRILGVFNLNKVSETPVGTPTNFVPLIVNNDNGIGSVHAGRQYSKVTLPSTPSGFAVGDWMRVAFTVSGTQTATVLTPYFNVLAKCVKISGNDVYFDYFNPFNFNGATYSFTRIYKIVPRKNVKLMNAKFYDLNSWDYKTDDDTIIPTDTLQRTISFVYAQGCVDCKFENIYGNNTTNPIISLQTSAYCDVNKLEVDRPAITSPGRGYGIQIGASTKITVDGVRGNYARHCIDFDGCSFSSARNINGRYMYATSFMTHGCYDHDILFEDCEGSCSLEAGISFGSATMNMTFRRCYINEFTHGYSPNLKFYDSTVVIIPTIENATYPQYWVRAEFHNSKVSLLGGGYKAIVKTGDTVTKSYLKFFNCDVDFISYNQDGTNGFPSFLNFDDVIFRECDVRTPSNVTNSTATQVAITGLKNLTILSGKLRSTYFVLNGSTTDLFLDFDGAELLNYNVPSGSTFAFVDVSYNSNRQFIKLSRMRCVYSGAGTLRIIRCGGTANNNRNQKFTCMNSYFKSVTANLVTFYIPQSSGVATNNTILMGNIMANTQIEGFATTVFPDNIWFTE